MSSERENKFIQKRKMTDYEANEVFTRSRDRYRAPSPHMKSNRAVCNTKQKLSPFAGLANFDNSTLYYEWKSDS